MVKVVFKGRIELKMKPQQSFNRSTLFARIFNICLSNWKIIIRCSALQKIYSQAMGLTTTGIGFLVFYSLYTKDYTDSVLLSIAD